MLKYDDSTVLHTQHLLRNSKENTKKLENTLTHVCVGEVIFRKIYVR